MEVTLTTEQQAFIGALVQDGSFPTANQAVQDAIELWIKHQSLKRDLEDGLKALDRGECIDSDTFFDDLEKELDERTAAEGR